jgi:AcrR family transcriptional regulator
MIKGSKDKRRRPKSEEVAVRQRILAAAFAAFMEKGYSETSTLEIATRAQVSKATLYALVGNKQQVLAACISERARRLQAPVDLPEPCDPESLLRALIVLGTRLLREMSDPTVIAVFRLAIAEAVRAPAVARALDSIGGEASRATLRRTMALAQSAGIVSGKPDQMAEQFFGLLWGNLMLGLLLRVAERPQPSEIERRAADAADAFLRLHLREGGCDAGARLRP